MTRLHLNPTTLRAVAVCLLVVLAASHSSLAQQQWERIGDGLSTPRGVIYDSTVRSVAVDSSGTIYAALPRYVTFGGQQMSVGGPIYRSTDDGVSWVYLRDSAARVVSPRPGVIVAQLLTTNITDSSISFISQTDVSLDRGDTWTRLVDDYLNALTVSRDGMIIAVAPYQMKVSVDEGRTWTTRSLPSATVSAGVTPSGSILAVMYEIQGGRALRTLVRSTDTGAKWTPMVDSIPAYELFVLSDGSAFIPAYSGDASSAAGLERSTDEGVTWQYAEVPGLGTATGLSEPFPGVLLLGSYDGQQWMSRDNGETWTRHGEHRGQLVRSRAGDLIGLQYAPASELHRSIDTSRTWVDISGGIQRGVGAFQITEHAESPAGYYLAATTTGLWRTVGLLDAAERQAPHAPASIRIHPQLVSDDDATVTLELGRAASISLTLHNGLGQVVQRLDMGVLEEGTHSVQVRTAGLSTGSYLLRSSIGSDVLTGRLVVVR